MGLSQHNVKVAFDVATEQAVAALQRLAAVSQQATTATEGAAAATGRAADAVVGAADRWYAGWGGKLLAFNQFRSVAGMVAGSLYNVSEGMDRWSDLMGNARGNIGRLQEVMGHLVSTSELVAVSNRLMSGSLRLTQDQMELVARSAWFAAERVGVSWGEAASAIAQAIGTGRTTGLAQLGIVLEKVKGEAASGATVLAELQRQFGEATPKAGGLAEQMDAIGNSLKDIAAVSLVTFVDWLRDARDESESLASSLSRVASEALAAFATPKALLRSQEAMRGLTEYGYTFGTAGGREVPLRPAGWDVPGRFTVDELREMVALEREFLAVEEERIRLGAVGAQGRPQGAPGGGGVDVAFGEDEAGVITGRRRGGRRTRPESVLDRPGMDRDADEVMALVGANERLGASLDGLMMQAGGAAAALDLERETMASVNAETRAGNEALERRKQDIEELARVTDIGAVASSALESGIVAMFEALRSGENVGKAFLKMVGMQFWAAGASGFAKSTLQLIEAILISANIFKGGPAAAASLYASAGKGFAMSAGLIAVGAGLGYAGGAFSGGGGGAGGGAGGGGYGASPSVGGVSGSEPQPIVINLGTNNVITSEPASLARAFRRILSDGADSEPGMSTTSSSGHRVLTLAP